jgi:polyphosphate kinase 2 (PPK2 family)
MRNPIKRWKLSPMDIQSRRHWVDYSKAKDAMFVRTDTKICPWHVVNADNKKRARLNCIAHLPSQVRYNDMVPVEVELPERQSQNFVPELY